MNSKTFTRISRYPYIKTLLAEAKRVKYAVTNHPNMWAEVTDPDNANALVFRAVHIEPKIWAVTYSTQYWTQKAL